MDWKTGKWVWTNAWMNFMVNQWTNRHRMFEKCSHKSRNCGTLDSYLWLSMLFSSTCGWPSTATASVESSIFGSRPSLTCWSTSAPTPSHLSQVALQMSHSRTTLSPWKGLAHLPLCRETCHVGMEEEGVGCGTLCQLTMELTIEMWWWWVGQWGHGRLPSRTSFENRPMVDSSMGPELWTTTIRLSECRGYCLWASTITFGCRGLLLLETTTPLCEWLGQWCWSTTTPLCEWLGQWCWTTTTLCVSGWVSDVGQPQLICVSGWVSDVGHPQLICVSGWFSDVGQPPLLVWVVGSVMLDNHNSFVWVVGSVMLDNHSSFVWVVGSVMLDNHSSFVQVVGSVMLDNHNSFVWVVGSVMLDNHYCFVRVVGSVMLGNHNSFVWVVGSVMLDNHYSFVWVWELLLLTTTVWGVGYWSVTGVGQPLTPLSTTPLSECGGGGGGGGEGRGDYC